MTLRYFKLRRNDITHTRNKGYAQSVIICAHTDIPAENILKGIFARGRVNHILRNLYIVKRQNIRLRLQDFSVNSLRLKSEFFNRVICQKRGIAGNFRRTVFRISIHFAVVKQKIKSALFKIVCT